MLIPRVMVEYEAFCDGKPDYHRRHVFEELPEQIRRAIRQVVARGPSTTTTPAPVGVYTRFINISGLPANPAALAEAIPGGHYRIRTTSQEPCDSLIATYMENQCIP